MRRLTMAKDLVPRLKEARMIKLGIGHPIKGKSGVRPERFDHFKIYTRDKDATGEFIPDEVLQEKLEALYGAPLRRFPIVFLYNDLRLNFPNGHRAFKGTRLFCEGDAEGFYRYHYEKKQEGDRDVLLLKNTEQGHCIPWPDDDRGERCPIKAAGECKRWGELTCMLPDFDRLGVVFKFRTTSNNSVRNIFSMLLWTAQKTGGVIAGIPFMLTCQIMDLETKDGRKVKQPIVNLEYEGSQRALVEAAVQEAQLIAVGKRNMRLIEGAALTEAEQPGTPEDEAEFAAEFYPEGEEPPDGGAIAAPLQPPRRASEVKESEANRADSMSPSINDEPLPATEADTNGKETETGRPQAAPIEEKQRRSIFAKCKEFGVEHETVKSLIAALWQIDSTTKIDQEQLPVVLSWIEQGEEKIQDFLTAKAQAQSDEAQGTLGV